MRETITSLYRSNGFRDVKVSVGTNRPLQWQTEGQIGVAVRIEEGPQWLVESVDFEGIADKDRALMETDLASAAGQPFSEVSIAADRNAMLDYYSAMGFLQTPMSRAAGRWLVHSA